MSFVTPSFEANLPANCATGINTKPEIAAVDSRQFADFYSLKAPTSVLFKKEPKEGPVALYAQQTWPRIPKGQPVVTFNGTNPHPAKVVATNSNPALEIVRPTEIEFLKHSEYDRSAYIPGITPEVAKYLVTTRTTDKGENRKIWVVAGRSARYGWLTIDENTKNGDAEKRWSAALVREEVRRIEGMIAEEEAKMAAEEEKAWLAEQAQAENFQRRNVEYAPGRINLPVINTWRPTPPSPQAVKGRRIVYTITSGCCNRGGGAQGAKR